jgi:hypothetical protein
MEWMIAGDSAHWACFLIFPDHVEVLAAISASERLDRSMSTDEAREIWSDLRARGWRRATDAEIDRHQMTLKKLREIAYGRERRRR